jgi:CspA family cold shock protein
VLLVASGLNPYTGSGEQHALCADYHQVEVLDDDEVERIYNLYRQFLPELLACSTNSPLYAGEMQRDFSLRMRFNPASFLPRYISRYSTQQLERLEYFMRREHGIADLSRMDIDPLHENALELRFIDAQCSFRFVRAQMLILQAIAMHGRSLARSGKRLPYMRNRVIGENKALAIQSGLTAIFRPDPGFKDDRGRGGSWFHDRGVTERSSTSLLQILDPLLLPYLRDLKCQYWELAPLILGSELRKRGKRCLANYAEYQKYLYYTAGDSFARLLQERISQLLSQPHRDWVVEYNEDTFPKVAAEVADNWHRKLRQRERKFGQVRWFSEDNKFGFIAQEEGKEDIFVHQTDLEGAGTLYEDQRVSYEVMDTVEGPRAVSVRVLPKSRKRGRVKWFDEEKGYGFICQEDGKDTYVNREDLVEVQTLLQGQPVSFDIPNFCRKRKTLIRLL